MQISDEFNSQLNAIATASDFESESRRLVDSWTVGGVDLEAIEPALRFIETHPAIDYGSPGPLVHFVERFWTKGYEEALLASVSRRPTEHTTWMLNRLINGEQRHTIKANCVGVLQHIATNATTEKSVRDLAWEFLRRLPG